MKDCCNVLVSNLKVSVRYEQNDPHEWELCPLYHTVVLSVLRRMHLSRLSLAFCQSVVAVAYQGWAC